MVAVGVDEPGREHQAARIHHGVTGSSGEPADLPDGRARDADVGDPAARARPVHDGGAADENGPPPRRLGRRLDRYEAEQRAERRYFLRVAVAFNRRTSPEAYWASTVPVIVSPL